MMISAAQLNQATGCGTATAARYIEPIRIALSRYQINTVPRIAAFLAQVAHESARFERVVENLNYSAAGLAGTWPSRYRTPDGKPNAIAMALHRRPEAIANHAYANRMGNGAPETGDGWRFRGRGLIQITGREKYRECGLALGLNLESAPDLLETPLYAALSAGWFWHRHGLNGLADEGRIEAISRRINGGTHGLAERIALTSAVREALAA